MLWVPIIPERETFPVSRALDVLQVKEEEDTFRLLAAGTFAGTNLDFQLEHSIYKRKSDGICFINLKRTRKKFLLAAGTIVANENLAEASVLASGSTDQRAMLKVAAATGAAPIACCFPRHLP